MYFTKFVLLFLCLANVSSSSEERTFVVCKSGWQIKLYKMSYGVLREQIIQNDNPTYPPELVSTVVKGYVDVTVQIDPSGNVEACIYDPKGGTWSKPPVPRLYAKPVASAICESVRQWQFKRVVWCDTPVSAMGTLAFYAENQLITLAEPSSPDHRYRRKN